MLWPLNNYTDNHRHEPKAVVAEAEGSAPLRQKRAFGRDPEPVASTSQPHNESLEDVLR